MVDLPQPLWPTIATLVFGSIVRSSFLRTFIRRPGYLNTTESKLMTPLGLASSFTPSCFGSILEGSSSSYQMRLADLRAFEIEGIKLRLTPEPIAPTNTM